MGCGEKNSKGMSDKEKHVKFTEFLFFITFLKVPKSKDSEVS